MTDLVTNDKQAMTALKQHGGNIVMVILVVLLAYFGFSYWQSHGGRVDTQAADGASALSVQAQALALAQQNPDADSTKETAQLLAAADSLASSHPKSVYGWQALMTKAHAQANGGDLAGAAQSLDQASGLGLDDEGLLAISRLQRVAVLLADNQSDEALLLLNQSYPSAFEPSRLELLGDILVAKNDPEAAKTAYNQAWALLSDRQENRALLLLKMQALGLTPTPIEPNNAVASKAMPELNQ